MTVLQSPKGWTGPPVVDGKKVEERYPVDTFLITAENVDKYGTDGWQ